MRGQEGQTPRVQQVPCRVRQGHGQHEHVGPLQQGVERLGSEERHRSLLAPAAASHTDHVHVQGGERPTDPAPDRTVAHDHGRPFGQQQAAVLLGVPGPPVPPPKRSVRGHDVTGGGDEQADRHLRHGSRVVVQVVDGDVRPHLQGGGRRRGETGIRNDQVGE